MNTINTTTLAAVGAVLVLSAAFTQAQSSGTAFTYQGSLAERGQPANGFYDLQFVIYNLQISGAPLAPALTNSVGVTNGLFNTTLDFGPGVFTGDARWLDISVRTNGGGAFTPLLPRQALTPTPYALTAAQVTGPVADGQLSANVARLNANQTFSGTVTFGPGTGPPFIVPPSYTNVIVSNLNAGNADTVDNKHARDFWQLAGNAGTTAGTDFLGTTDNQPLEFKVNNTRVLRFEPNATSPNVLEGYSGNFVQGGIAGATIGGGGTAGSTNQVLSDYGTIGGGAQNQVLPNSTDGTIGGGSKNTVGDADSTIGGGQQNGIAPGAFKSAIGGGSLNSVGSKYSVVSGGNNNSILASGAWDTIGGGGGNTIEGPVSRGTIGGGGGQTVSVQADSATIAGGQNNLILSNAQYSAIGGGFTNVIGTSAFYATIPGGLSNKAFGTFSLAAGQRAQAMHDGTFVWADSTAADFISTANNQFLIRAWGGVGIGKNNPATALDVNGTVTATSFTGTFQGGGSGLTNVSASGLSGLLPGPALGGVYSGLLQFPNTGNSFAGNFSGTFDGNGSGLANVPAASLVGAVPNSALSGTYSAPLTFSSSGNNISGLFHGGFSGDGSGLTNIPNLTNVFGGGGSYWAVSGNTNISSTNFLGTADNNALEVKVNSARALRLEPNATCPNFIAGYAGNYAAANSAGATISGGGATSSVNSVAANFATIGGGVANTVGADGATIAGGRTNLIQSGAASSTIGGGEASVIQSNAVQCTVGGGGNNTIQTNCQYSTIGGGHGNSCWPTALSCVIAGGAGNSIWSNTTYSTISGGTANNIETSASSSTLGGGQLNTIFPNAQFATISGGMGNSIQPGSSYTTIPGGSANSIAGQYSFAAGRQATVNHNGCFLWADSQNAAFNSAANDEAAFRCQGGARFTTGLAGPNQTVFWTPGSGTWNFTSDRNTKENITPVDPRSVLDKLSLLPLSQWNYKGYPQRHLGPMAQDFHAQFPFNDSETTLNEADLHGVALAAIQGLNQKLEAELGTVRAENAQLQHRLERLEQLMNVRNGGAQ